MKLEKPTRSILVTQTAEPLLVAARATEPVVDVYDARTFKKKRSIPAGQVVGLLLPY